MSRSGAPSRTSNSPGCSGCRASTSFGSSSTRKLPAPPLTHLSGLVVEEAARRHLHLVDPREPRGGRRPPACSREGRSASSRTPPSPARSSPRCRRASALLSSDLSINFLEPASPTSERLIARGTGDPRGRRQGLSEARVEDARGTLLAHATSRCVLQPLPFEPPEPPEEFPPVESHRSTRRPVPPTGGGRGRPPGRVGRDERTGSRAALAQRASARPRRTARCSACGSSTSPREASRSRCPPRSGSAPASARSTAAW